MKVMIDTNIIFSAILFPQSTPAQALHRICQTDTLVICDYVVNELFDIIERKRPDLLENAEVLLSELQYEAVDLIISGDKHFLSLNLERPKIITASSSSQ